METELSDVDIELIAKYILSSAIIEGGMRAEKVVNDVRRGIPSSSIQMFFKRLALGSEIEINASYILDVLKTFADDPKAQALKILGLYESKKYDIVSNVIKILSSYTRSLSKESITSLEVLRSRNYKLYSELYITPHVCSVIEIGCRAKAPAKLFDIELKTHSVVIRSECIPLSRLLSFILGDVARFVFVDRDLGRNGLYEVAVIPKIILKKETVEILKNLYLKLMPRPSVSTITTNDIDRYLDSFDLITELIISSPCLLPGGADRVLSIVNDLVDRGSWIYVVHRGCSPADLMCGYGKKYWLACIEAEEKLIDRSIEICTSQEIVETDIVVNRSVILSGSGDLLFGENFQLCVISDKTHAEEVASKLLRPCICSPVLIQSPIYFNQR